MSYTNPNLPTCGCGGVATIFDEAYDLDESDAYAGYVDIRCGDCDVGTGWVKGLDTAEDIWTTAMGGQ